LLPYAAASHEEWLTTAEGQERAPLRRRYLIQEVVGDAWNPDMAKVTKYFGVLETTWKV